MVDRFFLSVLWIFLPTIFWPPEFLERSQLLTLWGFPCKWWDIFLLLLSIFSPCNWLSAFSLWCVCMWIFLYLSYLGFLIFLDSSNFGKCSPLLLWIFFCPFSLVLSSWIPNMLMWVHLMLFYISLQLCLYFSIIVLCSSFWSICIISADLHSSLLILSSAKSNLFIPFSEIFILVITLLIPEFLLAF